MTEWKLTDNRVHGHGQNYTLPNRITAKQLHKTLNNYEKTQTLQNNIEQKYDRIQKQLIQLKLTTGTLQHEIQQLEEQIQCLSK